MAASKEESSAHKMLSLGEAIDLVKDMPNSDAYKLLELAPALTNVDGVSEPQFLQLTYQYGERIVQDGKFYLPEHVTKRNDAKIIQAPFSARDVPLAFLVDSPVEVFTLLDFPVKRGVVSSKYEGSTDLVDNAGHTRPLRLFHKGQLFGLFQLVDALLKRPPGKKDYSLSAGETTLHIGNPIDCKTLSKALSKKVNMPDVKWKPWDRHSLLVEKLMDKSKWTCSIVLVPDKLLALAHNPTVLENFILRTHISQMSQVEDEMNERLSITRIDMHRNKEWLFEQASYLLGIVRGTIPAMVPWNESECRLPLKAIRDGLYEFAQESPTKRNEEVYYPYIMVPRLLEPGKRGYFSCRWNVGPTVHRDPLILTDLLFTFLENCVEGNGKNNQAGMNDGIFGRIHPGKLTATEMFGPFIRGGRSANTDKLEGSRVTIDERDFIPLELLGITLSSRHSNKSVPRSVVLRPDGFLDCGFVITRPAWL